MNKKLLFLLIIKLIFIFNSNYASISVKNLIFHASKGNFTAITNLLTKNKNININNPNQKGETVLHWAIVGGNLDLIEYLLTNGANINALDKNRQTCLDWACQYGDIRTLRLLFNYGVNINNQDKYGWTALHKLVFNENIEGVKLLLTKGPDLTLRTKKKNNGIETNSTALDIAYFKNNQELIEILSNPDEYLKLSLIPIIFLKINIPPSQPSVLLPNHTNYLILQIENKGGYASNISIFVEKLSNCENISFLDIPEFSLESGSNTNLLFGITANKYVKTSKSYFKIYAKETSFYKDSNPYIVSITTIGRKKTDIKFSYNLIYPNNNQILRPGDIGYLHFYITNLGLGYSDDLSISIEGISNYSCLQISYLSNFFISQKTNIEKYFTIYCNYNDYDRISTFRIILKDIDHQLFYTNYLNINIGKILKPSLHLKWSLVDDNTFLSKGNSNNIAENGETIALNLNLLNKGDGIASNINIFISNCNLDDTNLTTSFEKYTNYNITQLLSNENTNIYFNITFSSNIDTKLLSFYLYGHDEKKYSIIDGYIRFLVTNTLKKVDYLIYINYTNNSILIDLTNKGYKDSKNIVLSCTSFYNTNNYIFNTFYTNFLINTIKPDENYISDIPIENFDNINNFEYQLKLVLKDNLYNVSITTNILLNIILSSETNLNETNSNRTESFE